MSRQMTGLLVAELLWLLSLESLYTSERIIYMSDEDMVTLYDMMTCPFRDLCSVDRAETLLVEMTIERSGQ